jgi:hypothetical protein
MACDTITQIILADETWTGPFATPAVAVGGWREVIVFVIALDADGQVAVPARLQISPDGQHWVDEGTSFSLPYRPSEVTFARAQYFGAWLRVIGVLPEAATIRVSVTIAGKA